MKLNLTLAANVYDRTFALMSGAVAPEGIDLNFVPMGPHELFRRQARHAEFDVAEFSLSTYTLLHAQGDRRLIGLPVFPSRRFRHSDFYVSTAAGIREPHDLLGQRIGVMEIRRMAMVGSAACSTTTMAYLPIKWVWVFGAYDQPGGLRGTRAHHPARALPHARDPAERIARRAPGARRHRGADRHAPAALLPVGRRHP